MRINTQTGYKIEVMQAFEDGKEIQYFNDDFHQWRDVSGTPLWNWTEDKYRIKPEAKPETMRIPVFFQSRSITNLEKENERMQEIISESYELIIELHQRSVSRHKIRQLEHLMTRMNKVSES